jgi:hypothetical protein
MEGVGWLMQAIQERQPVNKTLTDKHRRSGSLPRQSNEVISPEIT